MEKGVKKGVEKGVEKGMENGVEKEMEKGEEKDWRRGGEGFPLVENDEDGHLRRGVGGGKTENKKL